MAEQKKGCRISRYVCWAAALLYAIFSCEKMFFHLFGAWMRPKSVLIDLECVYSVSSD